MQFREEEKKKKELEDAEREKVTLKEKEEEERAEEEERRRKEEKERKEEEEYRKLAASFIVDEEGFDENSCVDGADAENQLQIFIQYIKVYLATKNGRLLITNGPMDNGRVYNVGENTIVE